MKILKSPLKSKILATILFSLPFLFAFNFYTIKTSNIDVKELRWKEKELKKKSNFFIPNKPLKVKDFWSDFYDRFAPALCEDVGEKRTSNKFQKKQTRKIISIVAREMGADPKLFYVWARRESNYRPFVRHEKPDDVNAANKSWNRHHPKTELYRKRLKKRVESVDNMSKKYNLMFELALRETYKDNPYFYDKKRWTTSGFGLYGMNPSYYTKKWDVNAPPEILCDPIIATVTAVWSARNVMNSCIAQGYEPTYSVINRGFSRGGNCSPNNRDSDFAFRAKSNGIKKERKIRLGKKWNSKNSNRKKLYKKMISVVLDKI